jgi:hypothetical protein
VARKLVWPALLGVTVFTLLIGVIGAQPYQHPELEALLFPTDCRTPCVLGLYPGMAVPEAIAALQKHPWVRTVETDDTHDLLYSLWWTWNGQQPAFLDSRPSIELGDHGGVVRTRAGLVLAITLRSKLSLGELRLMLGSAAVVNVTGIAFGSSAFFNIDYLRDGVSAQPFIDCPVHMRTFWQTTSDLTWSFSDTSGMGAGTVGSTFSLLRQIGC